MKSNTPSLEGVVPIFICDFWDIPLRGICKSHGETLFFAMSSDPESGQPLEYSVFRLPKQQTEFFLQQKAEFERLVGTFWSYSEELPFRRIGGWSGRMDWRNFYELPEPFVLKDELEGEAAELVGHFVWPPLTA